MFFARNFRTLAVLGASYVMMATSLASAATVLPAKDQPAPQSGIGSVGGLGNIGNGSTDLKSNTSPAKNDTLPPDSATQVIQSAPNDPDAAQPKPALVIRFNQPHVYYERALRQVVETAEKSKPGVVYTVKSIVPATGGTRFQNDRANENASSAIQAIVVEMRSLGVQPNRITTVTGSDEGLDAPEVRIFVN